MKYRTLPGTELNVSEVCLGTMTWGEQNSEAEAHAQLDYAIAQGINFIDTAEMYPVPPNATTQGRTETYLGNWLARAAARRPRHRDQGRRSRPPRLDPQRPHRSHARRHRRGGRHQPRAAADRLHRPLPDPLAAAQRADVRRDRVRSGEGDGRAVDPRAGRRHGRADQGRQDPPLRAVERDGVGRVRVPARREGAGRAGPGDDAEQLQPGVAQRRQRSRRSAVPREDVAARVQPARPAACSPASTSAARKPPECALHAVRQLGRALSQADRARGGRGVRDAREAARPVARCSSRSAT